MPDEPHLSMRLRQDRPFVCLPGVERCLLESQVQKSDLAVDGLLTPPSITKMHTITFTVWFKPGAMQTLMRMFGTPRWDVWGQEALAAPDWQIEFLIRAPEPRIRFMAVPEGATNLVPVVEPLRRGDVLRYLAETRWNERWRAGLDTGGTDEERAAWRAEDEALADRILADQWEKQLTPVRFHVNSHPTLKTRRQVAKAIA